MNELQLYGKTFPVALMEGLFRSLYLVVGGYSNSNACCRAALSEHISEREKVFRLIRPLFNYLTREEPLQDLDYRYTSLLLDGFPIVFGTKGARFLKKLTIFEWCFSTEQHGLQSRYGPGLKVFLGQLVKGRLVQEHEKQKLTILAMRYLFESFKHESEIDCEMQIVSDSIVIEIKQCPFCLNKKQDCLFFPILIDCFSRWAEGIDWQACPTFLQINQQKSLGHRISIDIVEQAV